MTDAPPSNTDWRDRLGGASLGAHASELITVRAGDLRACLGLADQVAEAQRLVGENARLTRERDTATARTIEMEALRDQLIHASGRIDALKARLRLAADILRKDA